MSYGEPTEIYRQLKARQAQAEADPLEIGTTLTWQGSNLEPDTIPPLDYPHNRSASPNPLRHLHKQIFAPGEGVEARRRTLTLVEPLKTGSWKYSQVWRAEINHQGRVGPPECTVVVKLFQESLFPIPEDESQRGLHGWYQANSLVANEATAYRLARDCQGSDVPLCYGFFKFALPSGEDCAGVVLEDLLYLGKGIAVEKYLVREAKSGRLAFDGMDAIMVAALRLQNRLHNVGLANMLFFLDQFILLRSSDITETAPRLVGMGFKESSSRLKEERWYEEKGRDHIPRSRWRWNEAGQSCLQGAMPMIFAGWSEDYEDLAMTWEGFERKRELLGFLCMHEVIPNSLEEAGKVDIEQPEKERRDRDELHLLLGGSLSDLEP